MALNVRLLDIPFESMARDARGNYQPNAPLVRGQSKIINLMGRLIVVADIDGFIQPFYLSSGTGGKTVPAGKWYPFFGIGDDLWINKLHSDTIAAYYHSDVFKKICTGLDARLGDIRPHAEKYPSPSVKSTRAIDFINQSFPNATANSLGDTLSIVSQNVTKAVTHLNHAYRRSAMRDGIRRVPLAPITTQINNQRD